MVCVPSTSLDFAKFISKVTATVDTHNSNVREFLFLYILILIFVNVYMVPICVKLYLNMLTCIPWLSLGDNSPRDSHVSAPLVSRGHDSFYSGLSFQKCLYSEQPSTTEVLFLSRVEGRFVYCAVCVLQSKGWAGLLAAYYKRLEFPKLRISKLWCTMCAGPTWAFLHSSSGTQGEITQTQSSCCLLYCE